MRIKENLYGPDSLKNELFLEQLITRNEEKILNLIYGMTGDYHLAQDLTQETFVKAFRSRNTFNGKSKFSTWLYRIAVNVTIDHQRKSCVRRENPSEDVVSRLPESGTSANPDQACQKTAIKEILFSNIARLPEQQKEVFLLREINGCSTREVAEILGCSAELVKWRLHKARSTLRKSLQSGTQYKDIGTYILNNTGLE